MKDDTELKKESSFTYPHWQQFSVTIFACSFPHRFVHIVVKPNIRVLQHNTGHHTQCTGRRGDRMENLDNLQFGFLRKECEGGEIRSSYDENGIECELNLVRYSQVLLVQ